MMSIKRFWLLLHLTRDGSPFEGVMKQIELLRTELAFALERWKTLTKVEGSHGAAGADAGRCLGGFGVLELVSTTLV